MIATATVSYLPIASAVFATIKYTNNFPRIMKRYVMLVKTKQTLSIPYTSKFDEFLRWV